MKTLLAYVGSYTTPGRDGHGNGINVYQVDPRTGAFTHLQHVGDLENPSFLAIDPSGRFLYSVHGDRSEAQCIEVHPCRDWAGKFAVNGTERSCGCPLNPEPLPAHNSQLALLQFLVKKRPPIRTAFFSAR